ncbi:sulfurtransferase TusA family protein [Clostridium pasteurianum]|uniref:Sulfite reductase, beta subunit (Hemoprotein) n=1 Tax=Clostridium pasteurianum BC1 TaxID=86416 RepID=R4K7B9_CLOPA|nr:sulfurtransferase TusA family protein [Clostridium pasteurianum]AGK99067.1 sulfite reductase, beta subunit (hemoprotein) [Clostridium pasteurianum BC1]
MIQITEDNFKAIEDFKEKADQYKNGDIDPLRFKAFRVSMGVYEQREKETYMVRTRVPGGVITLQQLQTINDIAKEYANGRMHITSRQDLQFHNVKLEDVYDIMKQLIEVGIITKGTGGNTVRNVQCAALSGVSTDDVFDVTPYVREVTNHLIKDPSNMNLPRKYKLAFSNSPVDEADATISDLGFIAKVQDGKKGFEVYGGGGFGGNPRVSLKLADFIEDKDVIYYVQGMKELFEKEGDRSNKNKARIRYIVARLGKEKFIQRFEEELARVRKENNLEINIDEPYEKYDTDNIETIDKPLKNIIFPQKQKGLYSVYVHPQSGNLASENLDKVINFINTLDYGTSIRVTNTQAFFVRDLKEKDVAKLSDIILQFTSRFNIDNSITCAGASTCQLGLCLSQNLLKGIKEEFKDASDDIKYALPRIYISGCPNSCAVHEKGKIGLSGRAKRTEDGLIPMYTIFLGGKVGAGGAKMGEVYGDILAKKVPKYLYKLAELKSKSSYENFDEFLDNSKEEIKKLVKEYSTLESFAENADLYYDFGACNKFTLEGRGAGECSTGVVDVIKLDLANAEGALEKYKTTKENADLYSSAVSSARALLVLNGVDTNKDREIFKAFKKDFVDTGYVKAEIGDLFDTLIDFKLGDIKNIADKAEDISYLYNKVRAMYDSLDGQLHITLPKEVEKEETKKNLEDKQENSYEVIDFRGVKCPINFVKVKVELAKIKSGEKRGFYLDDGAPIDNVPKSVEKEGHRIVDIDTNYDGYNLLIVEKK